MADYYDGEVEYDPEFLLADARLGDQCEKFWASEVGRYIWGRALKELQDLMHALYSADPDDAKLQRDIRQDMLTRVTMLDYLDEQMRNGQNSRLQYEETQGEDMDA